MTWFRVGEKKMRFGGERVCDGGLVLAYERTYGFEWLVLMDYFLVSFCRVFRWIFSEKSAGFSVFLGWRKIGCRLLISQLTSDSGKPWSWVVVGQ